MLHLHYEIIPAETVYPMDISGHSWQKRAGILVSLRLGRLTGWGEVTVLPGLTQDAAEITQVLESKKAMIERYALTEPFRFWHFLEHLLPGYAALIAGLDTAGWDLYAKLRHMPLYRAFGFEKTAHTPGSYPLACDDAETMKEQIQHSSADSFHIWGGNVAEATRRMRLFRQLSDASCKIRLFKEAPLPDISSLLSEMSASAIPLLELPASSTLYTEDLAGSRERISVACCEEAELEKMQNSGYRQIHIYPSLCGISPALRLLKRASSLGMTTTVAGSLETEVGATAYAHLGAGASDTDIAGPSVLKKHPASGFPQM